METKTEYFNIISSFRRVNFECFDSRISIEFENFVISRPNFAPYFTATFKCKTKSFVSIIEYS